MSENASRYGWAAGTGISLHDKIRADLKTAMVSKETGVRDTMRLIMGEFPSLTVSITLESGKKTTRVKQGDEITDDDILDIIRKLVKSEKTVLELKNEESSDYLELLSTYLPQMATAPEIKAWIQENIDLSAFKSPMQAMGTVMKHYGKLADGKLVQSVLKELSQK